MQGPWDTDDDNNDILYDPSVGDPDDLPDIWADSTMLLDDNDE